MTTTTDPQSGEHVDDLGGEWARGRHLVEPVQPARSGEYGDAGSITVRVSRCIEIHDLEVLDDGTVRLTPDNALLLADQLRAKVDEFKRSMKSNDAL